MGKAVYLTIDDAPSPDFSAKVNFLCQKKIPAVFFCRGDLLEQNIPAAVEAVQMGFVIANHSYNHPWFSEISVAECRAQIIRTDKIIQAIYRQGQVKWERKYFRFPYGDKGDLKMGYLLEEYAAIPQRHGRRPARWLQQLTARLLPPLYRRKVQRTARLGQARKSEIQACLQQHGYCFPPFAGITYNYFQRFARDHDWIWTYDSLDWTLTQRRPPRGPEHLAGLLRRLGQPTPPDPRGPVGEAAYGLTAASEEIILLHDWPETSPFFYAALEALLAEEVVFKAI